MPIGSDTEMEVVGYVIFREGILKGEDSMLRLTVSTEEYLMIGDNIKIVFLGGTKNHLRIMVDAPKEMDILRSSVLEKLQPELAGKNVYYAEPDTPAKYLKPKKKGNNTARDSKASKAIG